MSTPIVQAIAAESVPMTFIRILGRPYLRVSALRCIASILRNFFFLQWRSAFLPGRIPVSWADHALDKKIPFLPKKIDIYIDFVAFWIRTIIFLLRNYGRKGFEPVREFLESMGGLYAFAAEVYSKHLSTTYRPFYMGRPNFIPIHTLDPHLMCIPSLHVMVVIRTYTYFEKTVGSFAEAGFSDDGENISHFASQIEELRQGALDITEAVLYVKQHSVNCIPAALYAMTCFDPLLFPSDEAERFVADLFQKAELIDHPDIVEIREYILSLYHQFLIESKTTEPHSSGHHHGESWTKPLLKLLQELPPGKNKNLLIR